MVPTLAVNILKRCPYLTFYWMTDLLCPITRAERVIPIEDEKSLLRLRVIGLAVGFNVSHIVSRWIFCQNQL